VLALRLRATRALSFFLTADRCEPLLDAASGLLTYILVPAATAFGSFVLLVCLIPLYQTCDEHASALEAAALAAEPPLNTTQVRTLMLILLVEYLRRLRGNYLLMVMTCAHLVLLWRLICGGLCVRSG
jgi:hypothetical protein